VNTPTRPPNRRYSKATRNRAADDSVAQRLSLKGGSPSQNEVVRCCMAFVCAVGLHGNSLAALRSLRRTIFCRLFFTARHCRSSGSRYARRVQRHVLVLSFSGASTGNPCSGFGAYGNHGHLDCTLFTRSGAAPVNISPPAHSDLLLVHWSRALATRKR
jgi:hypothetical protein